MIGDLRTVDGDSLLGEVVKLKRDGYRLVTLTAVWADPSRLSILYHFDRDFQLRHLRLTVEKGERIPSITPVYFAAFLAENEIQDGFGVRFQGLGIDYGGMLFMQPTDNPPPYAGPPAPPQKKSSPRKNETGETAAEGI